MQQINLDEIKAIKEEYRWEIEKIKIKPNENLRLTEKEIQDIVQKLKEDIDVNIDVDLSVFQKEVKYTGLFPIHKPISLCEKYFARLMLVKERKDILRYKYIESLGKIRESVPNQDYIDNIFIPCILFLKEKYESRYKELESLYKLYDEKSKQCVITSFRTEREKQYGFLAITNVPEIEEKYNRLREDVSKNNNHKHLKITGDKLDYLYLDKDVDITTTIHCLECKKEMIIESFCDINVYRSSLVNLYKMKKLLDTLQCIAELINKKYDNIIKKKDFTEKVVYFSNMEHLTIAEICELIEEFVNVTNLIQEELEKILEDKEYLVSEFDISVDNEHNICYEDDVYSEFRFDSRIQELYHYALNEEETVRKYLPWIFSKDKREQPLYCF